MVRSVQNTKHFQGTYNAAMSIREDETDPNVYYFGVADPYVTEAEALWAIKRTTITGNTTKVENAYSVDGLHRHIWANRASLVYV